MRSVKDFEAALKLANEAPFTPARMTSGCGRAYVSVSVDKKERRSFSVAAKNVGLMYLPKAYGTAGSVIYVGYDNADGKALAKAEAMAASLSASGIPSYVDPVSD